MLFAAISLILLHKLIYWQGEKKKKKELKTDNFNHWLWLLTPQEFHNVWGIKNIPLNKKVNVSLTLTCCASRSIFTQYDLINTTMGLGNKFMSHKTNMYRLWNPKLCISYHLCIGLNRTVMKFCILHKNLTNELETIREWRIPYLIDGILEWVLCHLWWTNEEPLLSWLRHKCVFTYEFEDLWSEWDSYIRSSYFWCVLKARFK